ncbi:hypothetical protein NO559_08545 [Dasania sp. GY-MA-18]|uniref:Uncharacterized protein n=1 Tax=Dasania phycosphaerae TaxID=2950436 RepID=A0A9J6RM28_9GAMM|nr:MULTISPECIES: hypothetical protein [Dasania]MCR8922817.1 hypothetical protein [Dasania sp. GY-MA-18]MCZ0865248.1 hypothetical protein [Dasania phycosphaerae]MCZ0868973.1 hypothetical protein [Dasania phycosphaerae]
MPLKIFLTLALSSGLWLSASSHAELLGPFNWGATMATIKQQEQQVLLEEKAYSLSYQSQLAGQAYHLEYLFRGEPPQQQLVEQLYYRSLSDNNSLCAQAFRAALAMLTQHYGQAQQPAEPVSNCQQQLRSHWQLASGEQLQLLLDQWRGQPYVGLRITPAANP